MPSTYPIKGIPTTGGALPVRPELSSWSISKEPHHQKQVSLFLRALGILQKKDPVSDQLSYFRLATIHGAPGKPWDNAADPENSMGSAKGYCYHNSYLFPVWHRPFMALYEQCLYNVMINEILPQIKDASQRSSWEQAAQQWRLPFWDWAIPQADTKALGLPRIASQDQFSILKLDGTGTEAIVNPMQKYTNQVNDNGQLKEVPMGDPKMGTYQITYNVHDKIDKKIELDFGKSKSTSRFANPQDEQEWANGYQRPELVNASLQNPNWRWKDSEELTNGTLAHNVHRLLSENYFKSYKTFSSTLKGPGQDPKESLSLEMLHNNIHQWTGGGGRSVVRKGSEVVQIPVDGHMANVPVSSFDPIFWMHHNNVDRLFAIWQTLNPNRWLEASGPDDPQGSSKLVPFHRDEKATLFTVDDTRDWRKLGYTYPELVEGVTQEKLANLIFEKYGRQSVDELRDSKDGSGVTDTHFQDYVINVEYDRYALDGQPYTIYFMLELSDDQKYEVGQVFNFSAQFYRDCGNCTSQANEGVMSRGQVPLTPQLNRLVRKYKSFVRDASGVTGVDVGLNPEFMNVFLNKTLFWHVRTNAGNDVPLDQVPNLQVSIHTGKASFDDAKGAVYNAD